MLGTGGADQITHVKHCSFLLVLPPLSIEEKNVTREWSLVEDTAVNSKDSAMPSFKEPHLVKTSLELSIVPWSAIQFRSSQN